MTKQQQSIDIILKQKMLPLYFNSDVHVSLSVLQTLFDAGIRSVEYTNRGPSALENFKAMIALRDTAMPGMEIGIGTIKSVTDARAFLDAGADYIICPGLIPDVLTYVQDAGFLCVPGCMTTSEILTAERLGATFVKLFPGDLIGPGYVRAIKDIFPALRFMPTGGVDTTRENIAAWFHAGVSAVGMGSKLISKTRLEHKNYAAIRQATQDVIDIVQSINQTS